MKKPIKKIKVEVAEEPVVATDTPELSEDEIELDELIAVRDGLTKRNISCPSTLGILIDQLQRKLSK